MCKNHARTGTDLNYSSRVPENSSSDLVDGLCFSSPVESRQGTQRCAAGAAALPALTPGDAALRCKRCTRCQRCQRGQRWQRWQRCRAMVFQCSAASSIVAGNARARACNFRHMPDVFLAFLFVCIFYRLPTEKHISVICFIFLFFLYVSCIFLLIFKCLTLVLRTARSPPKPA